MLQLLLIFKYCTVIIFIFPLGLLNKDTIIKAINKYEVHLKTADSYKQLIIWILAYNKYLFKITLFHLELKIKLR